MKWFIIAMMYPIAPIMFAILYYHRKSRKNIILGVTLPWESHKNEAVVAIQKSYAKAQKIALLLITLLYIPAILLPEIESMAYQMVWFLVPLVSFYVIYAYYNQKLAHWKKAQPFAQPSEREDLEVEYRPDSKDRDPHPVWFAIPILVAWVPTIRFLLEGADRTLLLVSVISGFTPILCFLIYRTHFSRKSLFSRYRNEPSALSDTHKVLDDLLDRDHLDYGDPVFAESLDRRIRESVYSKRYGLELAYFGFCALDRTARDEIARATHESVTHDPLRR